MNKCVAYILMILAISTFINGCGGQFASDMKVEKEARDACRTFKDQAAMQVCMAHERTKIAYRQKIQELEQPKGYDSWKRMSTGIHAPGGTATAVAIDPLHPDTVYAAIPPRLYKTINGGESWSMLDYKTALQGPQKADVAFLAIDPVTPDTVYATTRFREMIKSFDGGNTWRAVDTMAPGESTGLLVAPLSSPALYWATSAYAIKSIDGGAIWTPLRNGLPTGSLGLSALAIDPSDPATIYIGTESQGAWKSKDGGRNWDNLMSPPVPGIKAIAVNPRNSNVLYAAGMFGFLKSTDRGNTWSKRNTGLTMKLVYSLAIDQLAPDTIYAGTFQGVFKSIDGGETWIEATTGIFIAGTGTRAPHSVNGFAIHPTDSQTIYAVTPFGLYKTTRGGGL